MGRKRRPDYIPPVAPAVPGELPSDATRVKISLQLTGSEATALRETMRLIHQAEPDRYPTVSRTMRRALALLYHSLSGAPPAS